MYNMNYSTSYENYGFNYNLSYIGLKAQGTVKKYFEIDRSTVFAGIGSGVAFHGYDDIARQEHVFEVSAYSVYDIPWFISPEFGFMHKDGKKQISISGHYLWYPGSDPFLFGELKQPANTATTAYRGSYLGLAITWDFLIPRKEKPIDIIEPVDPEIVDRDAIHTKTANMKPGKLTIKVWDHLTVDNDTISILFNGEIVLQEHGLTARKKTVKVDLEPGVNYLTVLAHNEGEQSPNSCAMIIRSGSDEFEYILNSSMMRNEGIAIHVSDD